MQNSTNQNSRALNILDRIQKSTGLSTAGRNALIQLINPFTDFQVTKTGYYDSNESSSVVQCVKFSHVVSRPALVPATDNWDCHIFNTPLAGTIGCLDNTTTLIGSGNFLMRTGGAGVASVGPVTVITGPTAANLSLTGRNPAFTNQNATGLGPGMNSSNYLDGVSRIIGMGFEVHNTTAPLSVQGAVATYRLPQTQILDRQTRRQFVSSGGTVLNPTGLVFEGSIDMYTYHDVPGSLADALLLDGSRQWEAKDGVMCVPSLVDGNIPVSRYSSVLPVCHGEQQSTFTAPLGGIFQVNNACTPAITDYVISTALTTSTQMATPNLTNYKTNNFNTTGSYFTGLSPSTTLVVNTIYYIERFPSINELDLVVLASPSPADDYAARQLYSLIMREMPVGVKVGDNADGDWFFQGLSSVLKFLNPAVRAIGGPLGAALGTAGELTEQWAQDKLKERNAKQKGKTGKAQTGSTWIEKPQPPTKISQPPRPQPRGKTLQRKAKMTKP